MCASAPGFAIQIHGCSSLSEFESKPYPVFRTPPSSFKTKVPGREWVHPLCKFTFKYNWPEALRERIDAYDGKDVKVGSDAGSSSTRAPAAGLSPQNVAKGRRRLSRKATP